MSDPAQTVLIEDARTVLVREVSPAVGRTDLQAAFAAWLVPGAAPGLSLDAAVGEATKATGAARSAEHVAVLALAAQTRVPNETERAALVAGLNWLTGREPVVRGTPMPFCMDGVTLAAAILGAKALGEDALWARTCEWVRGCRAATAGGQGLAGWQEWLLATVAGHAGATWERKGGDGYAAEVRAALRSRGIGGASATDEADECEVLNAVRREAQAGLGVARAALRVAALDWVRRHRPACDLRRATLADVCELLRRVPAGLKKWTWESVPRTKTSPAARQWHVENEYHVQNLLWLVLAPIFPDLLDEDSTPKVGPVQPRADICFPSLRAIVEAKFMRAGDAPKEMVQQIAEDASLYLVAGSRYDSLVPFIWDDSRRTEHHEEMLKGLRLIRGVTDAIIIPRPGTMVPPPAAQPVKKKPTKTKSSKKTT